MRIAFIILIASFGFIACGEGSSESRTLIWMPNNLNVDKFRNGDPILEAKSTEEWIEASEKGIPAWCHYDNKLSLGQEYGKLYNWYAINDPRGLAPDGWHIPSDDEWEELNNYIHEFANGDDLDAAARTIKNKSGWKLNGSNETGFSALPAGKREFDGTFLKLGESAYWWSSIEINKTYAKIQSLDNTNLGYDLFTDMRVNKGSGLSVRCVKD
jgi:uncharacterized protein (TIGR02145 family)